MAQQVRKPLAILQVGLPSGHGLEMLCVDQSDIKLAFQYVPDRFPVHPSGFHPDVGDGVLGKPVGQLEQILRCCAEHSFVPVNPTPSGDCDACGHRVLMNVQSAAAFVNDLHSSLLLPPYGGPPSSNIESLPRALVYEATVLCAGRRASQTNFRAQCTTKCHGLLPHGGMDTLLQPCAHFHCPL